MGKCILPCVKQMTSASSMHEEGHSKPVGALGHPRGMGWRGRWERGQGWEDTCAPMTDSRRCMAKSTQYCKVIKINKFIFLKGKKKNCLEIT